VELEEAMAAFNDRSIDLLALDEALERLSKLDPAQARLVELRFFGGMSVQECARELGVSERTVHYEWSHARAWLRGQLESL
jgi:RNA polymerase sigma factor (sigma-70 family)